MFKNSSKPKDLVGSDTKKEDKLSQDFITHNMPAPHRFSGQTFSDGSNKSDKAITVSGPESHHKVGLLIICGGLILIAALFYFGYSYFIKPYLATTTVQPTNIITEKPITPVATTTTPVTSSLPVETVATDTPLISTSTSQAASSSEITFPEETPVIATSAVVSTVDSDADGLTDAEEKIMGTDPNKADTDSDGYLDLAELRSDYDPLVPGKKNSETSKILSYKIDTKATTIYPATWETTRSEADSAVVFSDPDNKAFIQVTYQNNPGKITPSVWFAQQFSGILPGEAVSGESWQGFYSTDGLSAYIFNKDLTKVYSFSCSLLTADTSSVTLFHLMIKALIIK